MAAIQSSEDDPFGMFGEEEDDTPGNAVSDIVESLIRFANRKKHSSTETAAEEQNVSGEMGFVAVESLGEALSLPWRHPRYLGAIKLVASLDGYGGGRGYVAAEALPAGTLVMVEEPILCWPEEQLGKQLDLTSVRAILMSSDAQTILNEMEHFHPTKESVDRLKPTADDAQVGAMIRSLLARHEDEPLRQNILSISMQRGLANSDGTALTKADCVRLLLALRYNGLESGVYLHGAMLNHADQPNCVKFLPSDDKAYSEVRTTRAVPAGQAMTISYVPSILSHATRRKHLWDQHRFDIGVELSSSLQRMELVGGKLPPSAFGRWDDDSVTRRLERTVDELRHVFRDTNASSTATEQLKALELSSYELCYQATELLQNPRHLLHIPCLELHVDCADAVQRLDSSHLTPSQRLMLLSRLVGTSVSLVELQKSFHGADHYDLARSNFDLAQAVEELLSKSPKHLLDLKLDGLSSITEWASLEHTARMAFTRISNLYPHSVEDILLTGCARLVRP